VRTCAGVALRQPELDSLMNEQDRHKLFAELIGRYQSQLYAYIFAVVRNQEDTEDLFQSVCLVLWRKFDSFRPASSFFSWARQTAKFMVCNFLRHKRNLPVSESEALLEALAMTVSESQGDDVGLHLTTLRRCKERLSVADEELLQLRYVENLGIREIADRLRRLQPSVCRSLNRIRRWLFECIQMELAPGEHRGRNSHV
jgi:RNA polymerase sigma-70 factor, ECF subfamily